MVPSLISQEVEVGIKIGTGGKFRRKARKRQQCRDTDSRINTWILCVASLRHNVQYMSNMLSITKTTVYIASAQVIDIPQAQLGLHNWPALALFL